MRCFDVTYSNDYETMTDVIERLPHFIEEVYNKKRLTGRSPNPCSFSNFTLKTVMPLSKSKVIIIGGGIGGLAAAIALRQADIYSLLFEQAEELKEIGAGLSLWPNATKGLHILGLLEPVQQKASPIELMVFQDWQGKSISQIPIGNVSRKLGFPSLAIHRADLQSVLLKTLGPESVRLGMRFANSQQTHDSVLARFENEDRENGDFLVGADGLRSAVRQSIHRTEPLRKAGIMCWRGVVSWPSETPMLTWSLGCGATFGSVPIGQGRVYWYAQVNESRKPQGLQCFHHWHDPIPQLIDATPKEAIIQNDIYDLKPLAYWGEGHTTLLGDAAHPMTPNMGQGACQAIEDAVTLAAMLKREYTPSSLREYERKRRCRTSRIVNESWHIGRAVQTESQLTCWLRDQVLRAIPVSLMLRHSERIFDAELV